MYFESEKMDTTSNLKRKRRLYLILGTLLLLLLGLVYAWSVFIVPLEADFGWRRSETSMVFTLVMAALCVGGMLSGNLVKRFSTRFVLCASATSLLLGFVIASRVTTLPGIYMAYGVFVGLGVGLGFNSIINAVSKWFPDKKGIASGCLLMGFGAGSMVLGSIATALMQVISWRVMFLIFGLVFAVAMLLGATVLREPDEDQLGKLMDKDQENLEEIVASYSSVEMIRTKSFRIYMCWVIIVASGGLIIIGHAAAIVSEMGATPGIAALASGIVSIANGTGRLLMGFFYDKHGLRRSMVIASFLILMASGVLLLGYWVSLLPVVVVGFAFTGLFYGSEATISPSFTASYGPRDFALNFGIVNIHLLPAALLGNSLSGVLRTVTGSYQVTFVMLAIYGALALLLTRWVDVIEKEPLKLNSEV